MSEGNELEAVLQFSDQLVDEVDEAIDRQQEAVDRGERGAWDKLTRLRIRRLKLANAIARLVWGSGAT